MMPTTGSSGTDHAILARTSLEPEPAASIRQHQLPENTSNLLAASIDVRSQALHHHQIMHKRAFVSSRKSPSIRQLVRASGRVVLAPAVGRSKSFSVARREKDRAFPLERTDSSLSSAAAAWLTAISGDPTNAATVVKVARYEEMLERFQVRRLLSNPSMAAARDGGRRLRESKVEAISRMAASLQPPRSIHRLEAMERFQVQRVMHTASGEAAADAQRREDTNDGKLRVVRSAQSRRLSFDATGQANYRALRPQLPSSACRAVVSTGSVMRAEDHGRDMLTVAHELLEDVLHDDGLLQSGDTMNASTWVPTKVAGRFSLHRILMAWRRKFYQRAYHAAEQLLTPLSPFSVSAHIQNALLVLVLAGHIVYHPLELAFPQIASQSLQSIDETREILLFCKLLLMFNVAFQNERGELVTSRVEIVSHYLRGWFLPDLFSSIPVHMISHRVFHVSPESRSLRIFAVISFTMCIVRLVHELQIAHHLWFARLRGSSRIWTWLAYSRFSHLIRIAWIILFILLITHYMACIWHMLDGHGKLLGSPAEAYATSFYDALQLLQGQGVPTATTIQSIFASFAVLLGSVVLAIVFGHVAVLVANFNANSTSYQRKMEAVFAITSKMQLPEALRERIHQYYDHLWREYESLDGEIERFSKSLSHTLELEVVLCKYMDLIMGIPFWKDCSPDFQKQLMLSLRVRVYMPDDYVIRRGEVDDEFYMISRGSCELSTGPDSFERPVGGNLEHLDLTSAISDRSLSAHSAARVVVKIGGSGYDQPAQPKRGSSPAIYQVGSAAANASEQTQTSKIHVGGDAFLKILSKGQAFGEMALLMNSQRTADVRAITYVEMCVLNRSDFQRILLTHLEDRKHVLATMVSTFMMSNEADGVDCPLIAIVRSVYSNDDTANGTRVGAEEAAALILDVLNSDAEDNSIQYGVDARLRRYLIRKRDASRKNTMDNASSDSSAAQDFRPSSPAAFVHQPPSQQPVAAARVTSNHGIPGSLETRIERIEHLVDALAKMMGEMQSAIDRVAPPVNAVQGTVARHSSMESSRQDPRLSRAASSTAVTDGLDVQGHQESYRSGIHDDVAQPLQLQQSVRNMWITDLAGRDIPASDALIEPSAADVSSKAVRRHPPLRARMSTYSGSTLATRKHTAPSPTQFADQLFQTRPRQLVFRHSAESTESPYFFSSSALTEH